MPFLLAPHPILGWSSCLEDESRVFQHRHTVSSGLPLSYTAYCIWRKGQRNKQKGTVVARSTHSSNDRHCDTVKAIDQSEQRDTKRGVKFGPPTQQLSAKKYLAIIYHYE